VTSYSERNASLRVSFSRRVKLWFLLLGLWDIYILVLWFSLSQGSFIVGTLLANRCEPSSHGFPFCVTNITMLFFRARRLSRISTILFALGSYAYSLSYYYIKAGFFRDAFVFALAIAIILLNCSREFYWLRSFYWSLHSLLGQFWKAPDS